MKRLHWILLALVLGLMAGACWYFWRGDFRVAKLVDPNVEGPLAKRDLDSIAVDTLRVLVISDPLVWEDRIRSVTGLEFELLERFARSVSVPLLVIPVEHPDSLFAALWSGRGDVIAAQCVRRKDLRKQFALTDPYSTVEPVLATLRPDPLAKKPTGPELKAAIDTAGFALWSPFSDPRYRFYRAFRSHTPVGPAPVETEDELLMQLVIGRRSSAVVSDLRAAHEASRFPTVEFSEPIGPKQDLLFVVRSNAPQLLAGINGWLKDAGEQEARQHLIDSYAVSRRHAGPLKQRRIKVVEGEDVSPFDDYFRNHASDIPWDWQLLAAMAWKETRFDSTVTSPGGAEGIMQLMPRTSARLGLDSSAIMDDHIRIAALYLAKLDTMWRRAVPDREQRLRFVLGSYNAGPGHIIDAQRLAEQLGLDPQRWEHNVECAVLLLSKPKYFLRPELKNGFCNGRIVFHYVRDIVSIYDNLRARDRKKAPAK